MQVNPTDSLSFPHSLTSGRRDLQISWCSGSQAAHTISYNVQDRQALSEVCFSTFPGMTPAGTATGGSNAQTKMLGMLCSKEEGNGAFERMHEPMAKCFDIVTGRKGEL